MADHNEALRLAEEMEDEGVSMTTLDSLSLQAAALLRQQAKRIVELEAEVLEQARCNGMGAERDALKIAAVYIHSQLRAIVQAGGSNEAIGREFRKRCLPELEEEVTTMRAEVERLQPNAERYVWLRDNLESGWAICEWVDDQDGIGYYRDARESQVVDAAIDAARATHKDSA